MAKQKLKTHSGVSKRFKRTGTGKLVRRGTGLRHNLTGKVRARKRRLKAMVVVEKANEPRVNRLLPYS